jgi:Uma2 family endonuclease
VSTLPKTYLTPEQYLEIERKAEFKSEYYDGQMYPLHREEDDSAKVDRSEAHNLIGANVLAHIHGQLRTRSCRVYHADMRVRVNAAKLYTYPDIVVVCGQPQFLGDRRDTLLNPTLIVEVLSPSTEAFDRGRKFEHYRTLESLQEYLLISSERISAELFTRQSDGAWLLTAANRAEETIELPAANCRLALAEIYEKVEFA